jgi:hypothetical protein
MQHASDARQIPPAGLFWIYAADVLCNPGGHGRPSLDAILRVPAAACCCELDATHIEVFKNVARVAFTTRFGDSQPSPILPTVIMR